METEMDEYISYDIQKYYCVKPTGPIHCPVCSSSLSESTIEPSKSMGKKIIADPNHVYYDYGSSYLFVCNECYWWCVREHHEFVIPEATSRFGFDYMILSATKSNPEDYRTTTGENSQPWLKALDDLMVYDKVQDLPESLAAIFEGGKTWKDDKLKKKLT